MIPRVITFFRNSFSYLWLVVLAIYLSVLTVQSVLRSYTSDQDTKALQVQLDLKQQEQARLQALVVYYQSDDYKEKELRRALLLKMPNETVYALPESSISVTPAQDVLASDTQEVSKENIPYWRQWIDFLLNGKKSG